MNYQGDYKYKAVFVKSWGYNIYDLKGTKIFESLEYFDSKVEAELAALGHITLMERENKGEQDV